MNSATSPVRLEIAAALAAAFERLGAKPEAVARLRSEPLDSFGVGRALRAAEELKADTDLKELIGSLGKSLSDREVLALLREYNEHGSLQGSVYRRL